MRRYAHLLRPRLYLRATDDRSGQMWRPRTTILEPGKIHEDTCSYSALMALETPPALLVYSDFRYKHKDGTARKAIQLRRITVGR